MKQFLIMFFIMLLVSCGSSNMKNNFHVTDVQGKNYPAQSDDGVTFRLYAPDAVLVTIAGTFNGWNSDSTELKKSDDGIWSVTLKVKKGKQYYKYLLDGYWIADPDNPDTTDDGFGGLNSVIQVK